MSKSTRSSTWTTRSPQETFALGEAIGGRLKPGMVLGLSGPLGAGKTQLVKGIASGNAIDQTPDVTSPTFTLINEYSGRLKLVHVDTYRLENPAAELTAMGFDEMLGTETALVVEWADRIRDLLPENTIWIHLEPTGETSRTLHIQGDGHNASDLIKYLHD